MYMYMYNMHIPIKGLDKVSETFQALYLGPCPLLDSRNVFPSVEIVPTPCGSILHATRASQVAYNANILFSGFMVFLIFLLFIPLRGSLLAP